MARDTWTRPRLATQLLAQTADLSVIADEIEALTRAGPDPDAPHALRVTELRAAQSAASLAREIEGYAEAILIRIEEANRS